MTQLSDTTDKTPFTSAGNGVSGSGEQRYTTRSLRTKNKKLVAGNETDAQTSFTQDEVGQPEQQDKEVVADPGDVGGKGSGVQSTEEVPEQPPASNGGSGDQSVADNQAGPDDRELAQWTNFERKDFFSDALVERVLKMLPYKNDGDHLYALSRVPLARLAWGTKESTMMRLCTRGENTPITVWVFGHVASLWFFNPNDGEPNPKVSIGVAPLTQHAKSVAKNIIELFAKPTDALEPYIDHVSASRWQTERVPGQKKALVSPFRACYDATERYQSKSLMRGIPVENLKKGDLVLLEAQVTRYSTAEGGNRQNMTAKERAKNRAKGPTEWKVSFELASVSLLAEKPPTFDADPSSDGPNFNGSF